MPKLFKDIRSADPKSTVKTRINQSQAQKYLAQVPSENAFWCNNGTVLNNLRELKDALTGMSDQTFAYHSNAIKKDFSNWIKYVIGDEQLAEDLENATNRQKAAQIVTDRYNLLVSRAAG
jgi:hypothetical protein